MLGYTVCGDAVVVITTNVNDEDIFRYLFFICYYNTPARVRASIDGTKMPPSSDAFPTRGLALLFNF